MIALSTVRAYDPDTGTWRRLPDLPDDRSLGSERRAFVLEGQVVVVDTEWPPPATEGPVDGIRTGAWVLEEEWVAVEPPPPGNLIGTIDDMVLVARVRQPPDERDPAIVDYSRWTPGGSIAPLDVPDEILVDFLVDTPDGFVLIGRPTLEADPPTGPVVYAFTDGRSWRRLPDAPVFSSAEGSMWLPGGLVAGQLVLAGGLVDESGVAIASLDLEEAQQDADASWETVRLPLDPSAAETGVRAWLALAWDGLGTVYAYGTDPSPIFVSFGIESGELSVAVHDGRSVRGTLHWAGSQLLLLGGLGDSGPVAEVRAWSPLGEVMAPLDPDQPELSGCVTLNPRIRRGQVDAPAGVGMQLTLEEGLRDGWTLASGLVQVRAYDQGVDGIYYTGAVVRDPDDVEDLAVWVSPDSNATLIGNGAGVDQTTGLIDVEPDEVYIYAADEVAEAAATWRRAEDGAGDASDLDQITARLASCLGQ
ncbi:Kelch repeat-containing protein [Euzebya tangerina]|uniref:Kelch repeat-containing protein n=1 Tax=Euzebya tangerina TaxID=591198 RepID=UPI0013C2DBE0|nr:kelch repeat-containing protein [Euzebya tangerina]